MEMQKNNALDFGIYSEFNVNSGENFPTPLPSIVKPIGGDFVNVNLEQLTIEADGRKEIFLLGKMFLELGNGTRTILLSILLHALDGRRKLSTVAAWFRRMDRFLRRLGEHTTGPINSITLQMYLWELKHCDASYQKMLRSVLKYWSELKYPGLDLNLKIHLQTSKSARTKSPIELQAEKPSERPFSFAQVRHIISHIERLYINCTFSPQDNLLWRLIVTEALRPSQMKLLQFGDIDYSPSGRIVLKIPLVKSHGTPARKMMMSLELSESVDRALKDHISYVKNIAGPSIESALPIFCVSRVFNNPNSVFISKKPLQIITLVERTRRHIAHLIEDISNSDLFTRRFKHTKLTHLAILGASMEELMRAAFQTSPGSISHYVNMTDEAFDDAESKMAETNTALRDMFSGKLIAKGTQTISEDGNLILEPNMEEGIGSCSLRPCGIFAPFGCYKCPRFEAFSDGPHQIVLDVLLDNRERAIKMSLPAETIQREDDLISAVREVIMLCSEYKNSDTYA